MSPAISRHEQDFDAAKDSYGSWRLGIAAAREICIRKGQIQPDTSKPQEVAWAKAGECPSSELDTVRTNG